MQYEWYLHLKNNYWHVPFLVILEPSDSFFHDLTLLFGQLFPGALFEWVQFQTGDL